MAEMAKRGKGKGTGKEGSDGPHPFKGKGKGQSQGGKGEGPGKGPASASAVRLDPVLETAYQLYLAGRRPDQPRVSRNAWLRNNLRSDSTLRAELRGRMQAAHSAPAVGAQPAAAPKGELGSATPRQPPPPPKTRPRGPTGARNPQSTAVHPAQNCASCSTRLFLLWHPSPKRGGSKETGGDNGPPRQECRWRGSRA